MLSRRKKCVSRFRLSPIYRSLFTRLVAPLRVDDDGLAGHGVLVVVLVVLVEDGGDLLAVLPDGEQRLLVVVRGDVEDEEVRPARGSGEDARLGVHAAARVAVTALKKRKVVMLSLKMDLH